MAPPPPRVLGRISVIAALMVVAASVVAARSHDVRHYVQHAWNVGAAM